MSLVDGLPIPCVHCGTVVVESSPPCCDKARVEYVAARLAGEAGSFHGYMLAEKLMECGRVLSLA